MFEQAYVPCLALLMTIDQWILKSYLIQLWNYINIGIVWHTLQNWWKLPILVGSAQFCNVSWFLLLLKVDVQVVRIDWNRIILYLWDFLLYFRIPSQFLWLSLNNYLRCITNSERIWHLGFPVKRKLLNVLCKKRSRTVNLYANLIKFGIQTSI